MCLSDNESQNNHTEASEAEETLSPGAPLGPPGAGLDSPLWRADAEGDPPNPHHRHLPQIKKKIIVHLTDAERESGVRFRGDWTDVMASADFGDEETRMDPFTTRMTTAAGRALAGFLLATIATSAAYAADTTPPVVTFVGALPPAYSSQHTFTVNYTITDDSPFTVYCQVSSGSVSSCTNTSATFTITNEGQQSISIIAVDSANNESLPQDAAWVADWTAPTVVLQSTPPPLRQTPRLLFSLRRAISHQFKPTAPSMGFKVHVSRRSAIRA
ncbi:MULTISPECIES: hypothetical protein [Methylococcus]|uniref:Lipoprotein n=1 Tax=Methylococcus capsulatus TaxID=414 RepID=A0ABZ2F1X1_METCP|nr:MULTISPECIES: hypothetical protein [Methylococcus]